MKRTSVKIVLFALAVGYTVFVAIASLIEPKTIQGLGFNHADKLVHFLVYFVMMSLWFMPLNTVSKNKMYKVGGLLFLFSFLIELAQHFFTERRIFEWFDLVANGFGIVIGVNFMRFLRNFSGSLKSF
ncbi:MAG: VanZ family protein [Flavobacteriaceae bacterium]|nr:VanZ family protein [Flavobacteriaceae bacterium]